MQGSLKEKKMGIDILQRVVRKHLTVNVKLE